MSPRHVGRGAGVLAVLALAALACFQDPTSPAQCPAYCPGGRLTTVESLLATAIERDSSFQGYVEAHRAGALVASAPPVVDSRPIFETLPIPTRVLIDSAPPPTDTTTGPILVDSMKLTVTVLRRYAALRNLTLSFYRLPLGIESTTTFAGLVPAFAAAPLRTVNVDSLLAAPDHRDSVMGDTLLPMTPTDSVRHSVQVRVKFDQSVFSQADSGKLALGVRVSADSLASIALGSIESGEPAQVTWFYRVDSAGTIVRPDSLPNAPDTILQRIRFNGFVSDLAPVALDANLTVGGVPSTRALLRVALPRVLRDSSQIIRATLLLVPTGAAAVTTPDSVFLRARRIATDLGAKSPYALDVPDTFFVNSAPFVGEPGDTIRMEITKLFRLWQADTTAPTAVYLTLLAIDRTDTLTLRGFEGETFSAIRLFSSRTPAFRPSILLTFVPRLKFGAP